MPTGLSLPDLAFEVLRCRRDSQYEFRDGTLRIDGEERSIGMHALSVDEIDIRVRFLASRVGLDDGSPSQIGQLVWQVLSASAGPIPRNELIEQLRAAASGSPAVSAGSNWRDQIASRAKLAMPSASSLAGDPLLSQLPKRLTDPHLVIVETPFPWLQRLPLSEVYTELALVPLSVGHAYDDPSGVASRVQRRQVSRWDNVSIEYALDRLRGWAVVIGDPGSGKTTFVRALAAGLVASPHRRFVLPVVIPLREYWVATYANGERRSQPPGPNRLIHFFLHQAGIENAAHMDFWKTVFHRWSTAAGRYGYLRDTVLFLLDGWDEIPADGRELVQRDIEALMPLAPGLITSRPSGFSNSLPVQHCFALAGLDRPGVAGLIHRWFAAMDHPGQAESVLADLQKHPDLEAMSRNPFLLTLICGIAFNPDSSRTNRLPRSRGELYRHTLQILLGPGAKDHLATPVSPTQRRTIERFALWTLREAEGAPVYVFTGEEYDNFAGRPGELSRTWEPRRLLTSTVNAPGRFRFLHATFQEYLAALAWLDQSDEHAREATEEGVFNLAWFEVLRFAVSQSARREPELWTTLQRLAVKPDRFGFLLARIAHALAESNDRSGGQHLLGINLRDALWRRYRDSSGSWAVDSIYVDALVVLDPDYLLRQVVDAIDGATGEARERLMRAFDRIPSRQSSKPLAEMILNGPVDLQAAASQYADKLDADGLAKLRESARNAGDVSNRTRALRALAYAGDVEAIDLLADIIRNESDETIVSEAIESIGNIGGESAVRQLLGLLQQDLDEQLQYELLHALGSTDCPAGRDQMLEELAARDRDDPLTLAVLESLHGAPIPAWGQLIASFLNPACEDEIREAALHSLAECTDHSVYGKVVELARDDNTDSGLREIALQLLLYVRDPDHCEWLETRFNAEESLPSSERARCLEVLIETAHKWRNLSAGASPLHTALRCVRQAISHPVTAMAEVAARNAHLLGAEVTPLLLQVLRSRQASNAVRLMCCESLGALGATIAKDAVEVLLSLAESIDEEAHAIGQDDTQDIDGELFEFEEEVTDRMVAITALEALTRISPITCAGLGGRLVEEALAKVAAEKRLLVFDDHILDHTGRRIGDKA